MTKTLSDKIMPYVVGIIFVWALILGTVEAYKLIFPNQESTIKFEVTGIVNDTNATTLVQIHFECIKFCVDSSANTNRCWQQCALLGKELK